MTAFEQLIDRLGNMSGGHLQPRGAEIARIAWNAAIDAALVVCKDAYGFEETSDEWQEIQKLRSE